MRGFAPVDLAIERHADGSVIARSRVPLAEIGDPVIADLARWARETPARVFLAERDGSSWRTITYAHAFARAQRVARGLRARGADAEHPLAIVAENSIAMALVLLGAQLAGVPAAPVSTAYARDGADRARFDAIMQALGPALAYVDDVERYEAALAAHPTIPVIDDVCELERDGDAHAAARPGVIDGSTVAKILFTSGSTGLPKGVVTTHRMMRANQQQVSALWPFFDDEPPVFVDWLPWHHCYGGSLVFNAVLTRGGTLYIDDGRPVPARFARTLENLRDIAPTAYFGVPRAYAMLVPALTADAALRAHFFSRLRVTYSAGAALAQPLWEALDRLGRDAPHGRVPIVISWGATETAPLATGVHDDAAGPHSIGTPAPGCEIKLAPSGNGYELRARGPNITPGYWRDPAAGEIAFDNEGFYRTGDAGELIDESNPGAGLRFAGRIAENFKLSSGTWVDAHALRTAFVAAAAPLAADVLLCGDGRDEIGALVYPAPGARERGDDLRTTVAAALGAVAGPQSASSRRIARALIVADDASLATGEITDKGTLNRRVALRVRAAEIAALEAGGPDVILPA